MTTYAPGHEVQAPGGVNGVGSHRRSVGAFARAAVRTELVSVTDLLEATHYLEANRTRPASVRKDMHTGRVFFVALAKRD